METITKNIPALALRGLTVFPRMTASFDVEREISVRALERAMETGQEIFLVTQRELGVELPEETNSTRSAPSRASFRSCARRTP